MVTLQTTYRTFKKIKYCKLLRYPIVALVALFFIFLMINALFPLQVKVSYTTLIVDKNKEVLHAFLSSDDKWRMFMELDEISPELQKAILFKEDKYFYYHFGINPIAIARAMVNNIVFRKRTSGASTINMQVARMLQPKKRTYLNKASEMFRALQLEWRYSKKEILQLYLNLVPYGGNIEGVKAASVLYLGKLPKQLSIAELTVLSIVPNRPNSLKIGYNNPFIIEERNKWLRRFAKARIFKQPDINLALEEPFNASRKNAPNKIPHLAHRLKRQYPKQPIIVTTINTNTQYKAEQLVANYINRLVHQKITNAAVLVVNNSSHEVVAYVGAADFYNSEHAGQVDGVMAVRSPGSTLKPHLYALAFDQGIITPKTKISDVPTNFTGYAPVNYSGEFSGLVSVEHALINSLNVPAVKILNQFTIESYIENLTSAGFKTVIQKKESLGLSVILGGCGASLEELTALYTSFANKGQLHPLQYITDQTDTLAKPLISEAAAFVVADILSGITRPDLPRSIESSKNLPKIAWKTGTSYGRRDAWSIGFNPNYTIGVWVGNFSGEGVSDLNGASTATPLLFDVFNAIDYGGNKAWFISPNSLDFRWVCSHSGFPPSSHCHNQIMDYFLPAISNNKTCQHLQNTFISADSSFAYCTSCLPEYGYIKKQYISYPPEIIRFFNNNNIPYDKVPPHNPNCERVFGGNAPSIVSPVNELEYLIDPSDNNQIMLSCNVANDVKLVHWYLNKQYYKASKAQQNIFFVPQNGINTISCVDDKGRKTTINIQVKYL